MTGWTAKRFWKAARVQPAAEGWTVTLDTRPVRTPAKAPLILPTRALAEEVAREWDAQKEVIDPTAMPFTRTANSAIDKVAIQHEEVADILSDYGDADLLCYRADAPEGLVTRQQEGWDPLLDWAAVALDARLAPRTGLIHEAQDPAALARLRAAVHALTPFELAAFHDLVTLSGSLVLAFAVVRGRLDADAAWQLSRIDEAWNEELWGHDDEASAMAATKHAAFRHAQRFYAFCQAEH